MTKEIKKKPLKTYALYNGDKFVDIGTREYLAELLGVTVKTISFYQSPTYMKRTNGNGHVVICIDD